MERELPLYVLQQLNPSTFVVSEVIARLNLCFRRTLAPARVPAAENEGDLSEANSETHTRTGRDQYLSRDSALSISSGRYPADLQVFNIIKRAETVSQANSRGARRLCTLI